MVALECKVNRVILHSLIDIQTYGSAAGAIHGRPQRSTVAYSAHRSKVDSQTLDKGCSRLPVARLV